LKYVTFILILTLISEQFVFSEKVKKNKQNFSVKINGNRIILLIAKNDQDFFVNIRRINPKNIHKKGIFSCIYLRIYIQDDLLTSCLAGYLNQNWASQKFILDYVMGWFIAMERGGGTALGNPNQKPQTSR
jgi:hypothetical protein